MMDLLHLNLEETQAVDQIPNFTMSSSKIYPGDETIIQNPDL